MKKTVLITGADRGVGFAMCRLFAEAGWQVFAGRFLDYWNELDELKEEFPETLELISLDVSSTDSVQKAVLQVQEKTDCIDMLIHCAGIARADGDDALRKILQVNSVGALRVAESFLPVMRQGMKRLCFVSSEAGSITVAHRKDGYAYCMSKASLNMAVKLMFNELRPQGYTFRLYHPGWVNSYMGGDQKGTSGKYEPEDAARTAFQQFTEDRAWEDALVLTDVENQSWPF